VCGVKKTLLKLAIPLREGLYDLQQWGVVLAGRGAVLTVHPTVKGPFTGGVAEYW